MYQDDEVPGGRVWREDSWGDSGRKLLSCFPMSVEPFKPQPGLHSCHLSLSEPEKPATEVRRLGQERKSGLIC